MIWSQERICKSFAGHGMAILIYIRELGGFDALWTSGHHSKAFGGTKVDL